MKEIKDTKKVDIRNTEKATQKDKKSTTAGKKMKSKTEEGKKGRRKE